MTPEIHIRLRKFEILASLMTMPEATVDKHDCLILLQHNIRAPRQLTVIDPIAQPAGEKIFPDNHLRLGILPLDSRHASAPLFGCHQIRHAISLNRIMLSIVHHSVLLGKQMASFDNSE